MGFCGMTPIDWKYAFASVIGTSHVKTGLPCQDMSDCTVFQSNDGAPVLVAVVADGAGSAQRAEIGASLACSLFVDEMSSLFESGSAIRDITREFVTIWLTRFHNEIRLRAEAEGIPVRQFACTLLGAVIGCDCAAFFQIGDGAIVISSSEEPDDYNWIFWPQKGEYENITTFATDEAVQDKLDYAFVERHIEEVAIFTDGLQHLALHYQTRMAFVPFFRSMFSPLRPASAGHLDELSSSLASFLNSPRVNSRTDDDKTLILATRRTPIVQTAVTVDPHDIQGEDTSL